MLRLRLFGGVILEAEEGPLARAEAQRRRMALLALLACAGERGLGRDRIVRLLWPDQDDERGRHVLAQTLYATRRDLGEVVTGSTELRIDPAALWCDVQAFGEALARGDHEGAATLYAGPFMDGFRSTEIPDFERWVEGERRALATRAAGAMQAVARSAASRGDHAAAVEWWRRCASLDPCDARIAVGLMRALDAAGDRAGAIRHAQVHAELLRQELDLPPDADVAALADELRRAPAPPPHRISLPRRTERKSLPPGTPPEQPPPAPPVQAPAESPFSVAARVAAERAAAAVPGPERGTPPPSGSDGGARRPTTPELSPHTAALVAGRYQVIRRLGTGATADVHLCRDLAHDRPVALKVLRPEIAAAIGTERFLREIHVLAGLSHPHLLPLYDSGNAEGALFFVMPFVAEGTLRDRLEREGALPVDEAVRLAREVADALARAHDAGVVHRDVKPGNILLEDGHARVADFGIARVGRSSGGDRLTGSGLVLGTPAYMSPEQARGDGPVDARSDIYGLGCVLYEMLTGHTPPPAGMFGTSDGAPTATPSVRAARPAVPASLESIVSRAIAPLPADRFATAREMEEALARAAAEDRRTGRARRRGWVVAAVLATVALAAAGGALWRARTAPALDDDSLAIAPFDFAGGERLGGSPAQLAQYVQLRLNGAGRLRTVEASSVLRRWTSGPEAGDVASLARGTGARFVVSGQVSTVGRDSVLLLAELTDARARETVASITVRQAGGSYPTLGDSLAMRVLQEMQRFGVNRGVALSSIGTTSIDAIKLFLQGEEDFRRNAWDRAQESYLRAIEVDSGFVLALRRMRYVRRRANETDSLSLAYALRAGALNHGINPRDSVLVAADSVLAAIGERFDATPTEWALLRRLFTTLERAAREWDRDPEVWVELGEARVHHGEWLGIPLDSALAPFERAIERDSTFAPAYYHVLELSPRLRDADVVRRYATLYLGAHPEDRSVALVRRLLEPRATIGQALAAVPGLPSDSVMLAALYLRQWIDPGETAARLLDAIPADRRWRGPYSELHARSQRLSTYALRGRLEEAYAALDDDLLAVRPDQLAILALVPGVPRTTTGPLRARAERAPLRTRVIALGPWWAMERDTVALRAALDELRSRTGTRGIGDGSRLPADAHLRQGLEGYLALARGDTVSAVQALTALPDTSCNLACAAEWIVAARLLAASERPTAAVRLLDRHPPSYGFGGVRDVLWSIERARAAEATGDAARTAAELRFVAKAWAGANASLAPIVREVNVSIQRLSGAQGTRGTGHDSR